jgi:hypothetical protein
MENQPIYVFREEWDTITGFYRPSGESPNWNLRDEKNRYYYTFGEYLFERVEEFEEMLYKPLPGVEYVTIEQITSLDKYLYVVRLYEPMYFFLQDKLGLDFLYSQVKQDIRTGKCKLVFLQPFEGYTGVQEMVTRNDFKILLFFVSNKAFVKEGFNNHFLFNIPSSYAHFLNVSIEGKYP